MNERVLELRNEFGDATPGDCSEIGQLGAVLAFGRHQTVGRREVVEFLVTAVRGTHVAGTPLVRLTAAGAVGFSRFVFIPADGSALVAGGYTDDYVQCEARWIFARRAIRMARPAKV